jgi:putative glycerol-1-phosphate prenyltransferase
VKNGVLQQLYSAKKNNQRLFSLLIDPDKTGSNELERTAISAQNAGVDMFFVGGSLLVSNTLFDTVQIIKANCDIPVVLFPGDNMQVVPNADAILLLSVISGRNAEMLIGKHVVAAPRLKNSGLEIIPTGYMLIDSGKPTTASYMSNTNPLPHDKDDIAACTAMAGEMLGMKTIFMDGGSGALNSVSENMVRRVAEHVDVPIIVGGGLKTPEMAKARFDAGATVVVVGNAIEQNGALLAEMASVSKQ